jgi:hypothetical protein
MAMTRIYGHGNLKSLHRATKLAPGPIFGIVLMELTAYVL